MKIKNNFGLLKGLNVGFLYPNTGRGYHGQLLKVIKKGQNYRFIYDDCYIEISEIQFSSCKFELINDIYYFIPNTSNMICGLFLYSMYDTFGFPMEMTQEILEEKGFHVDVQGYLLMKEIQKQKNKNTFKNKNAF